MSVDLVVAPCSHEAAKFAVMNWHYSKAMPAGKTFKLGVWAKKAYCGCIIYSLGSGRMTDGRKYGLAKSHEVAELSRVALSDHDFFSSQAISKSLKLVKQANPGIRLVISFADYGKESHIGTLYQACNFVFAGRWESPNAEFKVHGVTYHRRTIGSKGWSQSLSWLKKHVDPDAEEIASVKYRYFYPLDKAMRRQIEPLAQPYPKRADVGEMESRAGTTD